MGAATVSMVVEALGDGYWLLDDDGRVLHASQAAIEQLDSSAEVLVGSRFGDLLSPTCEPAAWELLTARAFAESAHRVDVTLRGPRGNVPVTLLLHRRPDALVAITRHRPGLAGDPVTGLRSRPGVVAMLHRELADAVRGVTRIGVLHIDLDAFEALNSTFGPSRADRVLALVGERLSAFDGAPLGIGTPRLGRTGDDEFVALVVGSGPAATFHTGLAELAEMIQSAVETDMEIDQLQLRTTASIGIARWPEDGVDADELLLAASGALGEARGVGRRQVRFHEPGSQVRRDNAVQLDRDLRRATARGELEVHYQPIIDLRSGRVAAAEALARWHHPEHGPIPPSTFIPTAEATGSITAVGDLVLRTVAEDLSSWNDRDLLAEGTRVAVNVSGAEFAESSFVDRVVSTLTNAGVSSDQLELEVTETMLMEDLDTTAERLRRLDDLGFLVALDDFGTGYSSLSYLHSLPLHTLKIDRRFVGDLHDGRSETITRAILSLARSLGIVAVGEGVETDDQRHFLIDAGCDLVQGYYYAPPLPRAAFERFLQDLGTTDRG